MVHRDGRERRKLSVWIIFTFFFVAILGKTAHTLSPPRRINFRSYHLLNQPKVPFRLGDSNLQGDGSDSENASDYPEQESIYQNATLSIAMKQGSSEEPLNVEAPNVIQSKPTTTEAPSTRTILKFAIPAIGIWLCSPLMSIIDTSTVGLISGTAQQAALNPAIAVTDYSARCMSFLYTGTTNLVAVAQETDRNTLDQAETRKTLIGALRLSLRVGLGFCVFILAFSNPMLHSLIGNNSINPEVFAAAQKYVWIRSLSMPAAAIIGSAQAACLGMQDVKSPLYITLMAAAVNLIADLVLVPQSHPWIGGAAGAAWGTAFSQYVAVIIYIRWLSQGPKQETSGISRAWSKICGRFSNRMRKGDTSMVAETATWTESNENSVPSREESSKQSTRGFLHGSFRVKDLLKKRRVEDSTSRGYVPFVVPVTTTQVGRCSVYVAMGHVVSSTLGTVSMAANQILTAFFYALIPVADALSQTAQALLPRIFAAQDLAEYPREKTRVVRSALTSFGKAALLCGGALAVIVACIPLVTKLFMTSDPAVSAIVNSVVPIHLLIFCFHGVFCASEGILMAQKDLGYLGGMYALYFAVVPTIMLQLKRQGAQLQLQSIWLVFLGYQLFRISAWVGRVSWLFWKTRQAGESSEETYLVTALAADNLNLLSVSPESPS